MANTQMLASLLSGGGTGYTGGSRKRRLAEMLAQQGTDTSPVQHPLQGIARLAQAWAGKSMMDGHGDEATAIADILAPSSYEAGNSGQSVSGTVPFKFSGIGSGSNGIDVDYVSPEQHVAGVKTPSAQKQGGISTEKTIGVEMDGIHYVIPTIINDQTYTPQAAIEAMKTGLIKPLAKFNSQAEADAFAEQRSRDLDTLYGGQGRLMMGAPNPVDGVVHDKYPGQFPSAVEHAISVPIPQITETSDPKRQALISALSSGAVEPGAFQDAIASKLGFGKPKDPIKMGKSDRLFDPENYQELVGAMQDYNEPFLNDGTPNPAYQAWAIKEKLAGRPVTNVQNNMGPTGVDYGSPGDGLVWQRDPQNRVVLDERGAPIAIPYQGGKAFISDQEKAAREKTQKVQQQLYGDVVIEDANRLLGMVDSGKNITGFGSLLSDVPGTVQRDAKGLVTTLKSSVGFERLQKMREASPTGGALGNVSDRENTTLQAALGDLEQSQSKEQFKRNILRVRDIYTDIVHGPGTANRLRAERSNKSAPNPAGGNNLKKKYGLD